VFSRHYRRVKAIFGLIDSVLVCLAFIAAYQTRIFLNFERLLYFTFRIDFPVAILLLGVSVMSWLAIGYWFNIYEKLDSAHPSVVLRDTFRQCVLGAACLVLAEYLLRLDLSRFFVAIFATYAWILLCLFRINAARVIGAVRKQFGTAHYVMVVGSGVSARHLGEALEESRDYGVRLLGFLDDEPGRVQLKESYERYPLSHLTELLRRHVIDEIIFAVDSSKLSGMEDVFLRCDEEGVRTRVVVDFFPHVNSQVYLDRLGTN
jgi:FlaA1/EpsC-like NDP-sugar epimerase